MSYERMQQKADTLDGNDDDEDFLAEKRPKTAGDIRGTYGMAH